MQCWDFSRADRKGGRAMGREMRQRPCERCEKGLFRVSSQCALLDRHETFMLVPADMTSEWESDGMHCDVKGLEMRLPAGDEE
jgi:hypothetical protein